MGRRRTKDCYLPARVYRKHGAYYYVAGNHWTWLGRTLPDALRRYGELVEPPSSPSSVNELLDIYLAWAAANKAPRLEGFSTAWQRLQRRALAAGAIEQRFRFHDLRRKALTDAERARGREYARALGAHDDQRTTERYISGVEVVDSLG